MRIIWALTHILMVAVASAHLHSSHKFDNAITRRHQLRPQICQIRGGSFIDPAQVVRIHGFVGLAEAAILYGESFGLSPPYLGMDETIEGYQLTEVAAYLLRMQATQIVPWSLLEILNSDNPTVQSMFLGYQLTAFIMTAQIAWKSGLRQGNWVRPLLYTLFGSAFFGAVASSGPSTSAQ